MAPDLAYFAFPPPALRRFGHTPLGLLLFCVPVGLAVLCAFHQFFKRPLVLLMPRPVRAKLAPYCGAFPFLPWRRLAWICLLIYAGAVTHVLWDGITHDDGWAVREFPQLREVVVLFGRSFSVYGLLQYVSSVVGVGLLAWWSWQWYLKAPSVPQRQETSVFGRIRPLVGLGMVLIAVAVGLSCGLAYAWRFQGHFPIREFCAAAFITGVDAFGLTLLAFALFVRLHERRLDRPDWTFRRTPLLLRDEGYALPKKSRRHDWLFLQPANQDEN